MAHKGNIRIEIENLLQNDPTLLNSKQSDVIKKIQELYPGIKYGYVKTLFNRVRTDLRGLQEEQITKTDQYEKRRILTALDRDGKLMNVEEWCKFYGIPFEQARSYKLVTHTGIPYYNIASNVINDGIEDTITAEELKQLIAEDLKGYKFKHQFKPVDNKKINVIKISDLHFGAYVNNLIRTKDYSISILADKLEAAVQIINDDNAAENHVHILGDLIESFTGLNHKNSWKNIEHKMVGAKVVMMCCSVLHEKFLSKINNLKTVKIVAGNHDRLTSGKDEDDEGGAAELIAWGLSLIGYDVEFDSIVVKHEIDGICHVLMHGHHPVSKNTTTDICWKYGKHGIYNVVCEGHLHSMFEKVKPIYTIKDDSTDHRRIICPSFFTGNFYSESLGYSSNSGFIIFRNNGNGVPHMFCYSV